MPGTEHHTESRTGQSAKGNVVPLRPRQWLDPDIDLVPIATCEPIDEADATKPDTASASTRAADGSGHASTWLGPGEHTVPVTPAARAASDFWGEDAADLQLAVEAPPPPSAHERVAAAEPSGPARKATRLPRRQTLVAGTLTAALIVLIAISVLAPDAKRPPHTAPIQAVVSTGATSSAASARRSSMSAASTATAARPHHIAHARVRTHNKTLASRARTHHQHHRTMSGAVSAHTAATTPASAPTPARTSSPTPETTVSSGSGAGPTGTVSLIGAGTSPSS